MSQWKTHNVSRSDMEVLEESALAMAQATLQNAINEADLSRADLARRMDCPRSFVSRMLSGSHNLTIKTMARALVACGFEVRFNRVPIVWNWEEATVPPDEGAVPAHAGSTMPAASMAVGIVVPALGI